MTKNNKYIKVLLIAAGSLFTFLGILGIFLPLLPTTPFILLAAACFSRSSEKLYQKLLNGKLLGKYIRNYRAGKGIPLRVKISVISLLWLSIGYSVLFLLSSLIMKGVLVLIAVSVTVHILLIKTYRE